MPSSLISHQWEGGFQKTVITISSDGRGELTPTPAVTYCPTVPRLVLAGTFPKSPVQFEQLWLITCSCSLNKDSLHKQAEILCSHGFVQPEKKSKFHISFSNDQPSLWCSQLLGPSECPKIKPLEPSCDLTRQAAPAEAELLYKSLEEFPKPCWASSWGWECQGPWQGQDWVSSEVIRIEEIKAMVWSKTF